MSSLFDLIYGASSENGDDGCNNESSNNDNNATTAAADDNDANVGNSESNNNTQNSNKKTDKRRRKSKIKTEISYSLPTRSSIADSFRSDVDENDDDGDNQSPLTQREITSLPSPLTQRSPSPSLSMPKLMLSELRSNYTYDARDDFYYDGNMNMNMNRKVKKGDDNKNDGTRNKNKNRIVNHNLQKDQRDLDRYFHDDPDNLHSNDLNEQSQSQQQNNIIYSSNEQYIIQGDPILGDAIQRWPSNSRRRPRKRKKFVDGCEGKSYYVTDETLDEKMIREKERNMRSKIRHRFRYLKQYDFKKEVDIGGSIGEAFRIVCDVENNGNGRSVRKSGNGSGCDNAASDDTVDANASTIGESNNNNQYQIKEDTSPPQSPRSLSSSSSSSSTVMMPIMKEELDQKYQNQNEHVLGSLITRIESQQHQQRHGEIDINNNNTEIRMKQERDDVLRYNRFGYSAPRTSDLTKQKYGFNYVTSLGKKRNSSSKKKKRRNLKMNDKLMKDEVDATAATNDILVEGEKSLEWIDANSYFINGHNLHGKRIRDNNMLYLKDNKRKKNQNIHHYNIGGDGGDQTATKPTTVKVVECYNDTNGTSIPYYLRNNPDTFHYLPFQNYITNSSCSNNSNGDVKKISKHLIRPNTLLGFTKSSVGSMLPSSSESRFYFHSRNVLRLAARYVLGLGSLPSSASKRRGHDIDHRSSDSITTERILEMLHRLNPKTSSIRVILNTCTEFASNHLLWDGKSKISNDEEVDENNYNQEKDDTITKGEDIKKEKKIRQNNCNRGLKFNVNLLTNHGIISIEENERIRSILASGCPPIVTDPSLGWYDDNDRFKIPAKIRSDVNRYVEGLMYQWRKKMNNNNIKINKMEEMTIETIKTDINVEINDDKNNTDTNTIAIGGDERDVIVDNKDNSEDNTVKNATSLSSNVPTKLSVPYGAKYARATQISNLDPSIVIVTLSALLSELASKRVDLYHCCVTTNDVEAKNITSSIKSSLSLSSSLSSSSSSPSSSSSSLLPSFLPSSSLSFQKAKESFLLVHNTILNYLDLTFTNAVPGHFEDDVLWNAPLAKAALSRQGYVANGGGASGLRERRSIVVPQNGAVGSGTDVHSLISSSDEDDSTLSDVADNDIAVTAEGGVITTSTEKHDLRIDPTRVACDLLEFGERILYDDRLSIFPEVHITTGIAIIASILPPTAAEILSRPCHPYDGDPASVAYEYKNINNKTPFDLMRAMLVELERIDGIKGRAGICTDEEREGEDPDDTINKSDGGAIIDSVNIERLLDALEKAAGVFRRCVDADQDVVAYQSWFVAAKVGAMCVSSGIVIGKCVQKAAPSESYRYHGTKGSAGQRVQFRESKYSSIRTSASHTVRWFLRSTEGSQDINFHLAAITLLEWKEAIFLLVTRKSQLNLNALRGIKDLHAHHTIQWALGEVSDIALFKLMELVRNGNIRSRNVVYCVLATKVEQKDSDVSCWERLACALGPIRCNNCQKRVKTSSRCATVASRRKCEQCRFLRKSSHADLVVVSSKMKTEPSWWGMNRVGFWNSHYFHISCLALLTRNTDASMSSPISREVRHDLKRVLRKRALPIFHTNEEIFFPKVVDCINEDSFPPFSWMRGVDDVDSDEEDLNSDIMMNGSTNKSCDSNFFDKNMPSPFLLKPHSFDISSTSSPRCTECLTGDLIKIICYKVIVVCHLYDVSHPFVNRAIWYLAKQCYKESSDGSGYVIDEQSDLFIGLSWLERNGIDVPIILKEIEQIPLVNRNKKKTAYSFALLCTNS